MIQPPQQFPSSVSVSHVAATTTGLPKPQPVRKFSSVSPLGVGSGSETSASPSNQSPSAPSLFGNASAEGAAHLLVHRQPQTVQTPEPAQAMHDVPSTPPSLNSIPQQGAIPGLLPSYQNAATAVVHTAAHNAAIEPGPPSLVAPLASQLLFSSSAFHEVPGQAVARDDSMSVRENQILRHNVEVLKALVLQLATQLDLSQAREALYAPRSDVPTGTPSARSAPIVSGDDAHGTTTPSPALSEPEESVVLALRRKDELIDALKIQLSAQETWYEEALEKACEEKNNALRRLADRQSSES